MITDKEILLKKLECEHRNALPFGWREISAVDFARSKFMRYSSLFEEYRNMFTEGSTLSARLYFYYDGTGLAIHTDYWNEKTPIRYFAFGCNHEFRELGMSECIERQIYHAGRCWRVTECNKCGHYEGHDSSD